MARITDLESLKNASKQPPQAVEVERNVLGAMMLDTHAVPKAIEILAPEYFYDKKNALIFSAMTRLFEANEPIDTVSLYEELRKSGNLEKVGGPAYISQLAQDISSAANVEYHSRIVLEKWILRELIATSMEIATQAYQGTEDVFDLMDKAESRIFNITEESFKESYKSMDKAVKEAIEHIEAIHSRQIASFSVPSGFYALDDMLGGFQKSDLIIV
ncbi:MAG: replicative DNA helicase, partial [Ignavibacteria bacterium]